MTDLITQEFQWSRSLLSLLLRYMPDYVGKMPWRLKFLFVLCQSWYVFFALSMSMMYVAPIIAISFDMRFADVTYPAFIGHVLPAGTVTLIFAFMGITEVYDETEVMIFKPKLYEKLYGAGREQRAAQEDEQ